MTASQFGNGKECRKPKSNRFINDYHVIYVLNAFGID